MSSQTSDEKTDNDALARAISLVLIPPTVSTAVFTLLVLAYQHGSVAHRSAVWLAAVLCSGILQMAYVLYLRSQRQVTAYDVPERLQRTGPYLLSVGISATGLVWLLFLGAAFPVWSLMWCYTVNTAILAAINRHWKISAHVMGLTGPVTALAPLFGWATLAIVPVVAVLGWARVRIHAHTVAQVIAGAIAGAALTALQLFLISAYGVRILAPWW
jgi:membrane-associated phospholipid phosphatase